MGRSVAVIGAGNTGKVLALALKKQGYKIAAAFSRTPASREAAAEMLCCPVFKNPTEAAGGADIVLLTTPDSVIEEVCNEIASGGGFHSGQVVLHTSGAHSSTILHSAREQGVRVLSLHPLQTFPEVEAGLRSLKGTYFTMEGDEGAARMAAEMVEAMGGETIAIPTEMKPLYHAAACVACNYLVALLDAALKMFQCAGVPPGKAMEALLPIMNCTLYNVKELGTEKALTGPIARGDISTVKSHLQSMEEHIPELLPLYKHLGLQTVELASGKAGPGTELQKMKALLGGI